MSCPHATTTTLAWLYGEGDEAHAAHVASCPECEAVVATHADVLVTVGARPVPAPAPVAWRRWALAAAVLLAVGAGGWAVGMRAPSSPPDAAPTRPDNDATAALGPDDLDQRLDRLQADVALLSLDADLL